MIIKKGKNKLMSVNDFMKLAYPWEFKNYIYTSLMTSFVVNSMNDTSVHLSSYTIESIK